MTRESPEYLQISLAAAMTLRMRSGMFYRNARLHCLNLLLTYKKGCYANCAYCGLARQREGRFNEKSFIRVEWPTVELKEIIRRTKNHSTGVERICVSMITHPQATDDTIRITETIKEEIDLPISILCTPTHLEEKHLRRFKEAGADIVTVAIDTATEELFKKYRGEGVNGPHRWNKYWNILEKTAEIFGKDNAGCHLIVGLGETERGMVETMQRVRGFGAKTHLFSFYPEAGSGLEDHPKCPTDQFRRIQLARYLIDNDHLNGGKMRYDSEGRINDFGVSENKLKEVIDTGWPFMTSGCPGRTKAVACNRPYGDGPPSDIRSFPFKPEKKDIKIIEDQLWYYGDKKP